MTLVRLTHRCSQAMPLEATKASAGRFTLCTSSAGKLLSHARDGHKGNSSRPQLAPTGAINKARRLNSAHAAWRARMTVVQKNLHMTRIALRVTSVHRMYSCLFNTQARMAKCNLRGYLLGSRTTCPNKDFQLTPPPKMYRGGGRRFACLDRHPQITLTRGPPRGL